MKVCAEPGCPKIQPEPRCADHRRERERARGTRQQRGYGAKHKAERKRWEPRVAKGAVRCWRCGDYIAAGAAWDLGHDDNDRTKYRGPEHMACNRATAGRTPSASQVTIVCGPPCAGKTTFVREHMKPGDLVVDYDDIARRLGSLREHDHHPSYHQPVEDTIGRAVEGIKRGRHERAWIIRSGVTRARELAAYLGGVVVILDEHDDVLHARADRRPNPERTRRAIAEWRQAHAGISYEVSTPHPTPS